MKNCEETGPQPPPDWASSQGLTDYHSSVFQMERRADMIARGQAGELVWLLEHPPLYTAGTSTKMSDLIAPARFPVHTTGRGGELTYHGPGQRVVYAMIDVRTRYGANVRAFVSALERCGIAALATLGVVGATRPDRVGIWVERKDLVPGGEAKIGALGIRVRRGVSLHGLSINVAPDLEHFSGIVPCGIRAFGVTSLAALGIAATMKDVDIALRAAFEAEFGPMADAAPPL